MPSFGFSPFPTLLDAEEHIGVSAKPWVLDGNEVGDGSLILGWDYGLVVQLSRQIAFDSATIRQDCGLGRQSELRLVAGWVGVAGLNIGAPGKPIDFALGSDSRLEVNLQLEVPSRHVAERVDLTTVVTLRRRGDANAVAADQPGSILWQDRASLILEGNRPRMPILPADFGKFVGSQRHAAWYIWTAPEWLQQHPSSAITVYINSARKHLLDALRSRRPTQHDLALQSVFLHDVGRGLIDRALDDDDFSDEEDYGRGTAGQSLRATLRLLFDRQSIDQIRDYRKRYRADYERALQTRHKLLEALE